MDALDLRLLRAVGTRPFTQGPRDRASLGPTELGRRLGVHRNIVAKRLRALEDQGVVTRYQIYPNLHHLGLDWTTFHVELSDEGAKRHLLGRAGLWEGVCRFLDFVGPHVCFDVYYHDAAERDRRIRLLSEFLDPRRAHALETRRNPVVEATMDALDWRIVLALRGHAMKSPAAVAADLGVSTRTVERRLNALLRDGHADIAVSLDPSKIPGALPLGILLHFAPDVGQKTMDAALKVLDERYFFADQPPDPRLGSLAVQAYAQSAAEIEGLRQRLLALPNVQGADILINQGVVESETWLDDLIARKAGASLEVVADAR